MEMETQFMHLYAGSHICGHRSRLCSWSHKQGVAAICVRVNIKNEKHLPRVSSAKRDQSFFRTRAAKNKQSACTSANGSKKKGTIVGAVALIIGTSIGSGILALPERTSPAGFIPSSVAMIVCWGFLLIEALLLAEINLGLLKKKMVKDSDELEVISIRTMAEETLGQWGGSIATANYLFLGYTTMVAYTSKSGEILYHLINIPSSISGFFFTVFFAVLIFAGGTRTTDQVNQWLTTTMIGLLVTIEVLAVLYGGWSGLEASGDWGKVPSTFPVIIFSLVYHDLLPVICAYLDGDLARIRISFTLGSLVPLFSLLVWNAVALGLSTHSDQVVDPVDLFKRVRWGGVSAMVEVFSLLAVGTSLIGTLLGFSQFFVEQLNNLSRTSLLPQMQNHEVTVEQRVSGNDNRLLDLKNWWGSNKLSFIATVMVIAPPLIISTTVPDAFSAATDIAGGYCMTILYGVLPPAMAWAIHKRSSSYNSSSNLKDVIDDGSKEGKLDMAVSSVKPAVIAVGLFSCGIVIDQILESLSVLHP